MVVVYILLIILFLSIIYQAIKWIRSLLLFKKGHNPFHRICKKCGANQHQYRSNIEGNEHETWWEEVYPIGNDEKCKCHSYSQYRDW